MAVTSESICLGSMCVVSCRGNIEPILSHRPSGSFPTAPARKSRAQRGILLPDPVHVHSEAHPAGLDGICPFGYTAEAVLAEGEVRSLRGFSGASFR